MTIDEGAYNTFFSNRTLFNDAKLVFEKEGFIVESKYKQARKKWKGLPIIITSNGLHEILTLIAKDSKEEQERLDYKAFHNRIFLEKLTKSY